MKFHSSLKTRSEYFFLQIKVRLVNWNNYLMIKVFVLYGSMLREGEMGKINVKMENITSA